MQDKPRHPNCYYKKYKALEDIVKKNKTYFRILCYNIEYNPNPAKYGVKLIEETLDE